MIPQVEYAPVPADLQNTFATLHRCTLNAGARFRIPAILGQVWLTTAPLWWAAPASTAPALLPTVSLVGFTSAAFDVVPEADGMLYGCGLWPLGWAEVVRQDAGVLSDCAVPASGVWPQACGAWQRDTPQAAADEGWAALEAFARHLIATRRPSPDAGRIAAIDAWLNSSEEADALCKALGVSPRQVARITCRTHGGPPRLIAGKWRALRAAAELGLAGNDGGAVWARYADQSHFIREFRRFIGSTPGVFSEDEANVGRRVVADPWHVSSDHPLALYHGGREGA